MTMRRLGRTRAVPDVIAAAALLALGLVYGVLAVGEGIGTMAETGAGFFPLVVAVALVPAAAVLLVQGLRGGPAEEGGPADTATDAAADDVADDVVDDGQGDEQGDEQGDKGEADDAVHWPRVLGVLAVALLVPGAGATVGMVVTLSVTVALAARIMGVSPWTRAALLGAGFGAVTWLVFVRLLYVPLPAGTLGLV